MASAGRVLIIPTGDWVSGSDYEMLDMVTRNGSSYVAKNAISNSTTEPALDTSNWQLIAQGYADAPNIVTKDMIVNNLLATVAGNVLDATQGRTLDNRITALGSNIIYKYVPLGSVPIAANAAQAVSLSEYVDAGYQIIGITATITGSGTALCAAKHTSMTSVTFINYTSNAITASCGAGLILKRV